MPRIMMFVYSNALEGRDAAFNRWYDEVHLPEVIQHTKAIAAQRFRLSASQPEGAEAGPHEYLAIYEFDVDSQDAYDSVASSASQMDLGDAIDLGGTRVVFYDEIGARIGG